MDYLEHNKLAWNNYVKSNYRWTVPVSDEIIEDAKNGKWNIVLTPTLPVPHYWFPNLKGLNILGLASGGGQQGPILAALGAKVTILDNSEQQLLQDKNLSDKFNLGITTVLGDMRDLSVFTNNSFDLIFNPCSVVFVDNVKQVWKECYRVLKPNGVLMAGLINPILFQVKEIQGTFNLHYTQPFSDLKSLPKEELHALIEKKEALEFGHSLTDQIGGQMEAGFLLKDMYEDNYNGEHNIDKFLPTFIATKAIKLV